MDPEAWIKTEDNQSDLPNFK